MKGLRRYHVLAYEPDRARRMGSVLLYEGAPRSEVEHALVSVGVYAPRGLDALQWEGEEAAQIRDASGNLIVALFVDAFVRRLARP